MSFNQKTLQEMGYPRGQWSNVDSCRRQGPLLDDRFEKMFPKHKFAHWIHHAFVSVASTGYRDEVSRDIGRIFRSGQECWDEVEGNNKARVILGSKQGRQQIMLTKAM